MSTAEAKSAMPEADGLPTRERTFQVATELFYEQGYHATTMRDIATGVGIKAGSLYNHFSSKEELLLAICRDTTEALRDGAVAALDGVAGPEPRLQAFLHWHTVFHARRRVEARVADEQLRFLSDKPRREVVKVRDSYISLLRQILSEGVAAGAWTVEDEHVVSFAILAMCTEVDMWYRENGPLTAEQIAEIMTRLALHGLADES